MNLMGCHLSIELDQIRRFQFSKFVIMEKIVLVERKTRNPMEHIPKRIDY